MCVFDSQPKGNGYDSLVSTVCSKRPNLDLLLDVSKFHSINAVHVSFLRNKLIMEVLDSIHTLAYYYLTFNLCKFVNMYICSAFKVVLAQVSLLKHYAAITAVFWYCFY